jgi:hypothetical protein
MTTTIKKENPSVTGSASDPDGQHDAKDARVQVLTAEVRTLVVGSRQVTLSVYNQLDEVPPDGIEPFGRVRRKDARWRTVEVVGRDEEGALARSWVPLEPFDLKSYDIVRVYDVHRGTTLSKPLAWPYGTPLEEVRAFSADWPRLPLIVLAGLR